MRRSGRKSRCARRGEAKPSCAKTANIEHSTPNFEFGVLRILLGIRWGCWILDVRCSMFSRGKVFTMLIAFHKPYGVISQFTSDGSNLRMLAEFGFPQRVYPIGRLDADSEGLLLLSDEAEL